MSTAQTYYPTTIVSAAEIDDAFFELVADAYDAMEG